MYLESIQFRNFRNLRSESIYPSPGFNLLIGNNAQGKTNTLESIYLFANGRSFRTSEYRDMISSDQRVSDVRIKLIGAVGASDVRVRMDEQKKEFFKDEKKTRIGNKRPFSAVLFAPEEILLIKGSPSNRRKYIDSLIAQVVPAHMALVRKYERIVSQRNGIIQNEDLSASRKADILKPWDDQLVLLGARVIDERARWTRRLNEMLPARYRSIAPNDGTALWEYIPKCGRDVLAEGIAGISARLYDLLRERRDDEFKRRITLVGPQRDDMQARIDSMDVKHFGSQGQHRTFILALKISEIEFIKKENGKTPILLLDDVMSELDEDRNNYLFEYLSSLDGQVFITTTSNDEAKVMRDTRPLIFDVRSGTIEPRKKLDVAVCADFTS